MVMFMVLLVKSLYYADEVAFVKPSVGDSVEFRASLNALLDERVIGTSPLEMLLGHNIVERGVTTTGHAVKPATIISVALHTADEAVDVCLLLGVVVLDAEADAGVNVLGRATGLAEALVQRIHLGLGEF